MGNQGLQIILKALRGALYPRLGLAPDCDWVRMRLGAYLSFDLPKHEFRAVERHLHTCPACGAERESIGEVHRAMCETAMAPLGLMSADEHARLLLIQIRAEQAEHAQSAAPGRIRVAARTTGARLLPRLRSVGALAMAALLLVALPVLAYVGYEAWQALSHEATSQVAPPNPPDPVHLSDRSDPTDPSDSQASGAPSITPAPGRPQAPTTTLTDTTITAAIDQQLQDQIARAEVDAMLPHTEEEYEAWARREYPQIMWLYDVLTDPGLSQAGKQGLTQAERGTSGDGSVPAFPPPPDTPAGRMVQFGTDANGNPTITLPDAEGTPVTFTFPIPEGHPQGESLWDGTSMNTPDWAQRLYANTPESERPAGWRALLVYSGEIFKLDWPESLEEPNCIPTVEALQAAVAVAGRACTRLAFPASEARPIDTATGSGIPSDYVATLASDIPRAKSVVQYICVSALLEGTPDFRELSDSANVVLGCLCGEPRAECTTTSVTEALSNLLDNRKRQVRGAIEVDGESEDA